MVLFRQSSSGGSHVHRRRQCHRIMSFTQMIVRQTGSQSPVVIRWYHTMSFDKLRNQTRAGFHGHQPKAFQRKLQLTGLVIKVGHVPQLETLAIADSSWGNPIYTATFFFRYSICDSAKFSHKTNTWKGWLNAGCLWRQPTSFLCTDCAAAAVGASLHFRFSIVACKCSSSHGILDAAAVLCGRDMWWEHPQRIVTSDLVNDVRSKYCLHSL